MTNLKHRLMLKGISKALLVAGLSTQFTYALAMSEGSPKKGSNDELNWVKTMQAELLPYLPAEPKVRDTLMKNPKVLAAKRMVQTKQIEADINQGSPYEWEAGVSLRNRKDRTAPSGSGTSMDQEVNLSRSIRLPGKQAIKNKQSDGMRALGDTMYSDSLHEASLSLSQTWLECQRLESKAELFDTLGAELQAFSVQQGKRLKAGEVSKVEATQADLALQQILIEKAQNDRQLRSIRSNIQVEFPALLEPGSKRQCGAPTPLKDGLDYADNKANALPSGEALMDVQMDANTQEQWVERMLKMNHALKIQGLETEILREQSRMGKAELIADPKVGVSYSMERDNAEQILGVQVSMPFGGSVRKNQSRLAFSELMHSEQLLNTLTHQIRAQATQNLLSWEQNRHAAVLARNQARFSQRLMQSVEKAYLLGESSPTELTLARQQSHRSRMEAIDTNFEALKTQAQLLINAHQAWDLD